jgi:hypothetical protein
MSVAPPTTDIQFDRAEFRGDPVPLACASCGAAIHSTYYQVGQAITCEQCRWRADSETGAGSAIGRFVKAALLGVVAAAVGAGLYYAVRALTGYEFGLIAVVVGVMVGAAVRMGSAQRGGVPYQLLAMFLTYASIVSTYIPYMVEGYQKQTADPASGPLVKLFMLVVVVVIAFAAPFLAGFENIIGIVIVGIGLYEAWKINRKPDRTVTGPFRIEDAASGGEPATAA